MKFRITGEDRENGRRVSMVVEAVSLELAATRAHGQGIRVRQMERVSDDEELTSDDEVAAQRRKGPAIQPDRQRRNQPQVDVEKEAITTTRSNVHVTKPGHWQPTLMDRLGCGFKVTLFALALGFLLVKYVADPFLLRGEERQELAAYGEHVLTEFQYAYPDLVDWTVDVRSIREFDNGTQQGILDIEILHASGDTIDYKMTCIRSNDDDDWFSEEEVLAAIEKKIAEIRADQEP